MIKQCELHGEMMEFGANRMCTIDTFINNCDADTLWRQPENFTMSYHGLLFTASFMSFCFERHYPAYQSDSSLPVECHWLHQLLPRIRYQDSSHRWLGTVSRAWIVSGSFSEILWMFRRRFEVVAQLRRLKWPKISWMVLEAAIDYTFGRTWDRFPSPPPGKKTLIQLNYIFLHLFLYFFHLLVKWINSMFFEERENCTETQCNVKLTHRFTGPQWLLINTTLWILSILTGHD